MYYFYANHEKSSLKDCETGLVIQWNNGDFNGTNNISFDVEPQIIIDEHYLDLDLASFFISKLHEMVGYLVNYYSELL